MQAGCKTVERHYNKNGFLINPVKTDAILLTKRKKPEGLRELTLYGKLLTLAQESSTEG